MTFTVHDYLTAHFLCQQRHPEIHIPHVDLSHTKGHDVVTFQHNGDTYAYRLDLDEDDQVVLRPSK